MCYRTIKNNFFSMRLNYFIPSGSFFKETCELTGKSRLIDARIIMLVDSFLRVLSSSSNLTRGWGTHNKSWLSGIRNLTGCKRRVVTVRSLYWILKDHPRGPVKYRLWLFLLSTQTSCCGDSLYKAAESIVWTIGFTELAYQRWTVLICC